MLEEMDKSGKQFVDIKVRAYKYSVQVIRFIDSTEIRNKFYPLINQLLRSAILLGQILLRQKLHIPKKISSSFMKLL